MSEFGKSYMQNYPLEKGFEQFVKAVGDMLETDYRNITPIKPMYKKQAFTATEEANNVVVEQTKQEPIYVDTHGAIYRFLRRGKRLLKKILKR